MWTLTGIDQHVRIKPIVALIKRMLDLNIEHRITPIELYTHSMFRDLWADYPLSEIQMPDEIPVALPNLKNLSELNLFMFSKLIDWLIKVSINQRLHAIDNLGHAIKLMYRFLALRPISRTQFQLLGMCCLYLSALIGVDNSIDIETLIYLACDAYTEDQFKELTRLILETLEWKIYPTHVSYSTCQLSGKQCSDLYLHGGEPSEFSFLPEEKKFGIIHPRISSV